jgi:hypothetical protein
LTPIAALYYIPHFLCLALLCCAVLVLCPAGSTPVTVLVVRMGLRVDNKSSQLQERLHFLRDMMGVEHAMFFTFEGELLLCTVHSYLHASLHIHALQD